MEPRSAVGRRDLVGAASQHLTQTIAMQLPFESLGPFKTALKRFFSDAPWGPEDEAALSGLVAPHVADGTWEHLLDDSLTLRHEVNGAHYSITVSGDVDQAPDMWDRVFDGPVRPEPTPHPKKVKFTFGGEPAPGVWHLADDDVDDTRAMRLLAESDVTDVMIAGDFVTVGLDRHARWEDRLDGMIELVASLFGAGDSAPTPLTRDELVSEGQALTVQSEQLHLLNPDDADHRRRLFDALQADDARIRRIAVAVLASSGSSEVADKAVRTGYGDSSRIVRRMAIDAAGDSALELHRAVLELALDDSDAWTRWRAVRALSELGIGSSMAAVSHRADDPDFQVRFEVASVLRSQ